MDIVEELRKDRENGAKRLVSEYKAGLMSLARRFYKNESDAEELVNATFAKVVANIDDYLEQSAFFAWMCQILTNEFRDSVKRKSNKVEIYPGTLPEIADEGAQEEIFCNLDHSLLRDAIETLPREMKEAIMMHYIAEQPVPVVARFLRLPISTVKWRLHVARKELARRLGAGARDAVRKPSVKALLLVLAFCALTALGAGAGLAVVRLLSSPSAAVEQQADNSKDAGQATGDARQTEASNLSTFQPFIFSTSSNLPQSPSATTPSATDCYRPSATENSSLTTQGVKMNKTTTTRAAAMLAAATLATGAATTANADDYIWNVPEGETKTIDADGVTAIGTKNLVKTGRGTLVSSNVMSNYTGIITVREGAFTIRTQSDLGTADGGTVVEDGGTLVVNMIEKDQRFNSETFTIAGTGDTEYGAAIYQPNRGGNDQNKLFTYIALSDDATIFAGTHLGLASGSLSMDGHTLTVKGNGNFTFRHTQTPATVGNLVSEIATLRFRGGSNYTGNPSTTLTVRNGSTLVLGINGDNAPPIWWNLVVEEGGKVESEASQARTYSGDVEWNSTATEGASGSLTFEGNVTGTGTMKASSGTLAFDKPLGAGVGLGLSGTATAILPTAKAYSYEHKGMKIIRRSTLTADLTNFSDTRTDVVRDYCAFGPGPQLDISYWSISGNKSWCSRGYLWNRETTNVTYTIGINCVYQNYVFVNGSQVYYKKRDDASSSTGSTAISVPAGSCVPIDIITTSDQLCGPRTEKGDGDKFKINGVVATDQTGWYFTTNAVSGVANPAALPTLSLAGDGAIDMNGMPLSVDALSGAGIVTNTTTLTISNSWTLAAADIADGATLEVDGSLTFGNGCSLAVTDLSDLSTAASYTVASADSITGIAADGVEISDRGRTWKFVLSGDGKSIDLVYVPQATAIIMR